MHEALCKYLIIFPDTSLEEDMVVQNTARLSGKPTNLRLRSYREACVWQ